MKAPFFRRLSFFLAAALILCLLAPCGYAESSLEVSPYMLDTMPLSVFPKESAPLTELPAYFDGLLTCRCYLYDDTLWFPIKDLCTVFGGDVRLYWYPETKSLCITGSGIEISILVGSQYITINNRYILSLTDFLMVGTAVCFPAEIVGRMFGISALVSEDGSRALVDTSNYEMLSGSRSYYEDLYGEDFTLLTYLVNAEAGNSPMTGRVGVGNVIFNRVASPRFPDNVHDVIFDQTNSVQFAPTVNGRLYDTPNELSRIAVCLVYEGYNTVDDALFFDEAWADLSWLSPTHFVCKIGGHSFYN